MLQVTNFTELLRETDAAEGQVRIDAIELPRTLGLKPRYALVISGEHASEVMQMLCTSLDAHFERALMPDGPPPSI